MSKIWIVLTDDWELRGNGTGTVEECQRRPALRLMDVYDGLGIKSTFNLEVMQQLAFEQHAKDHPEIARGRDAWLDAVAAMNGRGFDTQLHIHPQWWKAEYIDGWWKLGRRWDISRYSRAEISDICDAAFGYIEPIIAPREIRTFRAGSWGMGPPSRPILEELIGRGIRLDVSIAPGLRYDGEGIQLDYSRVESPYLQYRPDLDDVRAVARNGARPDIVEIPTQSCTRGQIIRALAASVAKGGPVEERRLFLHHVIFGLRYSRTGEALARLRRRKPPLPPKDPEGMPDFVMRDPFGVIAGTAEFGFVMDLSCGYSLAQFRHMADISLARARRAPARPLKVLVFENHTKDLRTEADFDRIARLIEHIRRSHPDVEFRTLSEVADRWEDLA